ncbi:hypothetical protein O181_003853 [Austropuccinia psidii MF-1]|uniref:Uncharacterized protein n=1 Tax=Austropuccinia psidii MF-1 TaxID=1389203 RepID=A0A9Q3GDY6_9BASI|nr:hypothetical protein [Austropuccinia psidii MF-1]
MPIIRSLNPIALDAIYDIPPPINLFTHPNMVAIDDVNSLCPKGLGNLYIKNIKQLLQFEDAEGIPNLPFDNIKICNPFSISKAEHHPYMSPLRKQINQLGDMIDADLLGPLPLSINNKKIHFNY